MDRVSSIAAAVVLSGDRLRLLDSRIVAPVYDGVELGAMGGVQIRGATHEVDIIDCEIIGGWGNGISLGQVESFVRSPFPGVSPWQAHSYPVGGGAGWLVKPNMGAIEYKVGGSASDSNSINVWLPVGPVEKVRIHDNLIHQMGLSGVASMEFFDSESNWETSTPGPMFIVTIDVDISHNTIEDNVKLASVLPADLAFKNDRCVGGVCLGGSINALIRGNQILRNGTESAFTPVCGVGLVAAQNATIADNRIIDNGPPAVEGAAAVTYGLRGGIAVVEVAKPLGYTIPTQVSTQAPPQMPSPVTDLSAVSGASALVVRGNEVRQPLGRALWVQRGFGGISVTGNRFESFGNPVPGDAIEGVYLQWVNDDPVLGVTPGGYVRPASGACLEVVDFGLALDVDWSGTLPKPIWADNSDATVNGGNVLVSGNVMSLDWDVLGGHACSVLISTLGSAVFDSNSSTVTTRNPFDMTDVSDPASAMSEFFDTVIGGFGGMSLVLANVYVGGVSTVQASGNRSTEGLFDALFSLVAGPAFAPTAGLAGNLAHGVSIIANVGTHCWVGADGPGTGFPALASPLYNVSIYPDETVIDCDAAYEVSTAQLDPSGRVISIYKPPTGS